MRSLTAWLSVIAIAVVTPIALALLFGTGSPQTFWSRLLVITGTQAIVLMVLALLFASRLRSMTGSIGINNAIGIHRVLGTNVVLLVLLHVISVVADNPTNAWLVDAFQAPARALAGTAALIVLIALVILANRKKKQYESWRLVHRIGSVVAALLIIWHIIGLNQLVNSTPWLIFFITILLCIVGLVATRWRRGDRFVVGDIYMESPTVSTVSLKPMHRRLPFEAGQFIWVKLGRSVWAEDHPFTISSSAESSIIQITFRHTGDWTRGPLAALRPGRVVWIDGPHGAMNLSTIHSGLVMIAAGVGLTPVMSTLRTLADRQDDRTIDLFVPPTETLFQSELAELQSRLNLEIHYTLTRPISSAMLKQAIEDYDKWTYFICGPPSMVSDSQSMLDTLNVPSSRVITEQFEMA